MTGSFVVEWLPGGVLLQRRTGQFTAAEARDYVAAVEAAITNRPSPWGVVVDGREAAVQTQEVEVIIQDLIQYVVAHDVRRVAMVSSRVVTGMQQRRITTAPGMHDATTVGFFTDYDAAVADVRAALVG